MHREISPHAQRVWLAVTVLVAVLSATNAYAAAQVGQPAPEFSAVDSHGKTHQLSDYRGKLVVLEWTNHQCPYVRKHYDSNNMQTLQKEAAAQDVVWLSVISSAPGKQGHVSAQQANELTADRGAAPAAVLLDGEGSIGRAYGAKTTPHMYVVDRQGTLVYMGGIDDTPTASAGDVDGARNYVRAALEELQSGKSVGEPVTRPYGCSVKY